MGASAVVAVKKPFRDGVFWVADRLVSRRPPGIGLTPIETYSHCQVNDKYDSGSLNLHSIPRPFTLHTKFHPGLPVNSQPEGRVS